MKSISFPKSQITSKRYCQDINLVFEKDTAHNKFVSHDRIMASEFRYRRTLWGTLNRFI